MKKRTILYLIVAALVLTALILLYIATPRIEPIWKFGDLDWITQDSLFWK